MTFGTTICGFPRMGEKRELKKALEGFWSGNNTLEELIQVSMDIRRKNWLLQKDKGIGLISCNDFSWYDHILDTAVALNAIPERFRWIEEQHSQYFAMARGVESSVAMQMTKWFNTNYHYIVPELDASQSFRPDISKIRDEYQQALELGIEPKINLIGPVTFLGLSRCAAGGTPYNYSDRVFSAYEELLREISQLGDTVYVQLDEPIFARDPLKDELFLLSTFYGQLKGAAENLRLIVTTYFEHSCEATSILADLPIWGLGLDFVHGAENIKSLEQIGDKHLIAGIVDGRNIWANSLDDTLKLLESIASKVDRDQIILSTSCSLLHVPYSLANEPDSPVKKWLAFACEKVDEVVLLGQLFHGASPAPETENKLKENRLQIQDRRTSPIVINPSVQRRLASIGKAERRGNAAERKALQQEKLNLPDLPTTTIGSFPQTPELRKLRRAYKNRQISPEQYEKSIQESIDSCIAFQEDIGLDVLVHGEPERNDMVEYFGELLSGFHFTDNGWVQSYGSRCVKPPVIFGDVERPKPMTVSWITYAQSRTKRPMKGMLTGPVTILNWSFVRDDIPRSEVSRQIALALSDEIEDLQKAGISIIQVDEAAFKEGYPLRKKNIPIYEQWAVSDFKLAVSKADLQTQIHTHMCYSSFNEIIETIENMDADVISIETARSGNSLLTVFRESGYKKQIGPGVYDIHSPRIPSREEFIEQINSRMEVLPLTQLWINPDCGLKTRKWEEVKPALSNMVQATQSVRANQSDK